MPVNDWIAAGKSASQGLTNLFKVARENSPDYGMLATENMKNRSKERQVANAAEATIRREGLKALTRVKKTGIEIEADEKILDQKISAKRKAGYVGALGSIALGGFTAIDNNKRKAREAEQDAAEQAIWDEWRTRQDSTLSELRGQITQIYILYYILWRRCLFGDLAIDYSVINVVRARGNMYGRRHKFGFDGGA